MIFLSSMTHRAGHLDFNNLQLERQYTGSSFAPEIVLNVSALSTLLLCLGKPIVN